MARRQLNELVEPFSIAATHITQHAGVGIVVGDELSTNFDEIVQNAELARYEAKRHGKGLHVPFNPESPTSPTAIKTCPKCCAALLIVESWLRITSRSWTSRRMKWLALRP